MPKGKKSSKGKRVGKSVIKKPHKTVKRGKKKPKKTVKLGKKKKKEKNKKKEKEKRKKKKEEQEGWVSNNFEYMYKLITC